MSWGDIQKYKKIFLTLIVIIIVISKICVKIIDMNLKLPFLSSSMLSIFRLFVVVCMVANLSACDQLRGRLAEMIAPQSPEQALKSIDTMVNAGQLKEALIKAESFAEKPGDLRGYFELAAARVAAMQGDVDAALRYLARAVGVLNLSPDQLMADEAFSALHTDIRFLQTITGQASTVTPAKKSSPSDTHVKASEDTQIKMTNQGTEVRAGDVVIKLPN